MRRWCSTLATSVEPPLHPGYGWCGVATWTTARIVCVALLHVKSRSTRTATLDSFLLDGWGRLKRPGSSKFYNIAPPGDNADHVGRQDVLSARRVLGCVDASELQPSHAPESQLPRLTHGDYVLQIIFVCMVNPTRATKSHMTFRSVPHKSVKSLTKFRGLRCLYSACSVPACVLLYRTGHARTNRAGSADAGSHMDKPVC
jgi:hypothetical protein